MVTLNVRSGRLYKCIGALVIALISWSQQGCRPHYYKYFDSLSLCERIRFMDTFYVNRFSPDRCVGSTACLIARELKGDTRHPFYHYIFKAADTVAPKSFDWIITGHPWGGAIQYWGPDWDYDIWKMLDSAGCRADPYVGGRSEPIRIDSVIRGYFPVDAVAYAHSPSLGDFILLVPLSASCAGTSIDAEWNATLWPVTYIISRWNSFSAFTSDTSTGDNLVQAVPGTRFMMNGATIIEPDKLVFRDSCLCTDSVVIRRQCPD